MQEQELVHNRSAVPVDDRMSASWRLHPASCTSGCIWLLEALTLLLLLTETYSAGAHEAVLEAASCHRCGHCALIQVQSYAFIQDLAADGLLRSSSCDACHAGKLPVSTSVDAAPLLYTITLLLFPSMQWWQPVSHELMYNADLSAP